MIHLRSFDRRMEKNKIDDCFQREINRQFIYDLLYVIGGQDSSRKTVNLNEGYPPKDVSWTQDRDQQLQDTGLQQKKLTVRSTAQGVDQTPGVELQSRPTEYFVLNDRTESDTTSQLVNSRSQTNVTCVQFHWAWQVDPCKFLRKK